MVDSSDDEQHDIIFEKIENVENIISMVVENIYNDDSYQEYLTELKNNDTASSNRKAVNITKTFAEIQVFNTNAEPLFIANDIGIIIGASNVNVMIKNYSATEKITGVIKVGDRSIRKTFLTKHGIYRILLTNKSKLSDVFRGFIYKLIDHMLNNDRQKMREILSEYTAENPELVNESKKELLANFKKYKLLYDLEILERARMELARQKDYALLQEAKSENIELENEQNFDRMHIEQLKIDRYTAFEKLQYIKEDLELDETAMALVAIKKKFFKEFTISLVSPTVLNEVFTSKKVVYDIAKEVYTLDRYNSDFDVITQILARHNNINTEEIFYLCVTLGAPGPLSPTPHNKDEMCGSSESKVDVYAVSEYVQDKNRFAELLDVLKNECEHYQYPGSRKNFIYKTSIENIKSIARNLIIL